MDGCEFQGVKTHPRNAAAAVLCCLRVLNSTCGDVELVIREERNQVVLHNAGQCHCQCWAEVMEPLKQGGVGEVDPWRVRMWRRQVSLSVAVLVSSLSEVDADELVGDRVRP